MLTATKTAKIKMHLLYMLQRYDAHGQIVCLFLRDSLSARHQTFLFEQFACQLLSVLGIFVLVDVHVHRKDASFISAPDKAHIPPDLPAIAVAPARFSIQTPSF